MDKIISCCIKRDRSLPKLGNNLVRNITSFKTENNFPLNKKKDRK